ncbi:hypothetical protein CHITON_0918 [Thermococcus chitonophagus]|uniref:Uncharacterized protein n=1 Tax=Thermococcus chitonophagus TaxID=54262 RepID=A0A160VRV8_9EURY|nr:hypothetical protein CHITON_0918 [Thermococcus chitonophagus]
MPSYNIMKIPEPAGDNNIEFKELVMINNITLRTTILPE